MTGGGHDMYYLGMRFWLFLLALVGWLVAYAVWTAKDYEHTVVPCVHPWKDIGYDDPRLRLWAQALNPRVCFAYKLGPAYELRTRR